MPHSTAQPAPPRPHTRPLAELRGIPGLALLAVVALGVALTGLLADGARERGDLAAHDPSVTAWFVHARTPTLDAVAQVITMVGSEPSVGILTLLVVAWLVLSRRDWTSAVLFVGTMGMTAVVIKSLKHLVGRHRPPASDVLGPLDSSFAFPSGHALYTTVFFGLVAGLLLARTRSRAGRVLVVLGWVLASAVVGASRVYLGYHWLTDVVASWALAMAVLACAAAAWRVCREHPLPSPAAFQRAAALDDRPVARAGS